MPTPVKAVRKVIFFKNEVTYATDPVPVVGTDAMVVYNWKMTELQINSVPRTFAKPYFGNDGKAIAGKYCKIDFDVYLEGSGVLGTPPRLGRFLKASAHSETISAGVSVVYAPVSSGEGSGTFYFYEGGIVYKAVGSLGNAKPSWSAGGLPTVGFSFMGLYVPVADAAFPAPVLPAQLAVPVNVANTTPFTLFGYAGVLKSLAIDAGCVLNYRNLPNSESIVFTDRSSSGQIVIEKPLIATKDFYSVINAETLGALSVTHGPATNQVVFAAGQVQVIDPASSEDNGIAMLGMKLEMKPSSAGNNEYSFTFQ